MGRQCVREGSSWIISIPTSKPVILVTYVSVVAPMVTHLGKVASLEPPFLPLTVECG